MADNRVLLPLANAKATIAELQERSRDPRVPRAEQLMAAIRAEAREDQLKELNRDNQAGTQKP